MAKCVYKGWSTDPMQLLVPSWLGKKYKYMERLHNVITNYCMYHLYLVLYIIIKYTTHLYTELYCFIKFQAMLVDWKWFCR